MMRHGCHITCEEEPPSCKTIYTSARKDRFATGAFQPISGESAHLTDSVSQRKEKDWSDMRIPSEPSSILIFHCSRHQNLPLLVSLHCLSSVFHQLSSVLSSFSCFRPLQAINPYSTVLDHLFAGQGHGSTSERTPSALHE